MLALVVLVLAGVVAVTRLDDGGPATAIWAEAPDAATAPGRATVPVPTTETPAAGAPTPTTVPRATATTVPAPATTVARVAPTTVATTLPPATVASTLPPTTVAPSVTPTTAPGPAPAPTTAVSACHNSVDPSCGPFRFDPQPAADRPMVVSVTVAPAAPKAGQEVVFRIVLTDPDGVSHGSSLFMFGDSGIGETSAPDCDKFGAWDPPPLDPAHATEVHDVRHTYFSAGTYVASFAFNAGPFGCVDAATGRGDRPYASSGSGAVTLTVG